MTDPRAPGPSVDSRSGRAVAGTPAADPAALAAASEVEAARAALDGEIGALKASARAAVDVKAKVRRNPGKAAAAAGGAAFVAVGGPGRILGAVRRRVFGEPEPLPDSLLPDDVEKAVRALGRDGAKVRGALERSFGSWLDATAKSRKADKRQRSLVNLAMKVGMPVATRAAKEAISRAIADTRDATRPAAGRPDGPATSGGEDRIR